MSVGNSSLAASGQIQRATSTTGSSLVFNSIWNLCAYVVVILLGIISVPLYVHYLGPKRYGLMILLYSILTPMSLLDFGFGKATIKYVAESLGRNDLEEAGTYVRATLCFNLLVGTFGMIVILASARILVTRVFKIDVADWRMAEISLYWVAFGWLINQIIVTYQNVVTAFQRFAIVALVSSLTASVGILLSLAVMALGGNLLTIIQSRVLWNVFTIVIWILLARRLLPGISLLPDWNQQALKRSLRFGVWQSASSIGSLLAGQTDRFLLGIYQSTAIIGLYNIADTIQVTIYSAIYKIGDVLLPTISDLQGSGREKQAINLMLRSGWFLSVLTVCVMGPLIIFAHDIVRLYMNEEIANQIFRLLQLFALESILSSGSVSIFQYILGTGRTEWLAISTLTSGLVILIGGLLLIPLFGMMGAGWAQLLAIVISRPVVLLFLWRLKLKTEVEGSIYTAYLYGPAVTAMLVAALLSLIRQQLVWWTPGWAALGFGMLVSALLLFTATWGTSLFLPGAKQRQADLAHLWLVMKRLIQKQVTISV